MASFFGGSGGVLGSSVDSSEIENNSIVNADINSSAAIAMTKLDCGADPNADRLYFWDDSAGAGAYLTPGTNLSISGTTINASGGLSWSEVTGTTQSASVNTGYILNNASLVTLTLPSTAAVGDVVRVAGKGAGGWRIAQNSGQQVHFLSSDTTAGIGGRLDSTVRYDCVGLVCITANTDWVVTDSMGNITVT